jgi:hypothetical protein
MRGDTPSILLPSVVKRDGEQVDQLANFPPDKYKKQGEITMRICEIVGPANTAQPQQQQQQQQQPQNQQRQPVALEPTEVTQGRMRREMAKKIAKSRAQNIQPTGDDLAIAFTRACQAQNAVDDAAAQSGDYRKKHFNG